MGYNMGSHQYDKLVGEEATTMGLANVWEATIEAGTRHQNLTGQF